MTFGVLTVLISIAFICSRKNWSSRLIGLSIGFQGLTIVLIEQWSSELSQTAAAVAVMMVILIVFYLMIIIATAVLQRIANLGGSLELD